MSLEAVSYKNNEDFSLSKKDLWDLREWIEQTWTWIAENVYPLRFKSTYDQLLKNNNELIDYYKNYTVEAVSPISKSDKETFFRRLKIYRKIVAKSKSVIIPSSYPKSEIIDESKVNTSIFWYLSGYSTPWNNIVYYRKNTDNTFFQRETITHTVDLNAPMSFFCEEIPPMYKIKLSGMVKSWLVVDHIEIYVYDPNFLDSFSMSEEIRKTYEKIKEIYPVPIFREEEKQNKFPWTNKKMREKNKRKRWNIEEQKRVKKWQRN